MTDTGRPANEPVSRAGRESLESEMAQRTAQLERVNEALRQSEERYGLALEATEEGHFDVNVDTDELLTSERLNEIYGFPPGTRVLKRSEYLKDFGFYGDDGEVYRAAIAAAEAPGGPSRYEFEYRIQRPSGELRWLKTRGLVIRDAEGRARRRTGMVADITEAKNAEAALRESEERYGRAVQASEAGFWEWTVASDTFYASPRLLEIYGFEPGTTFAGRADFLARFPFHAEDKSRWERAIAAHFAGHTARFDIEMRLLPRGELRWIHLTGLCTRDKDGTVVRWSGSSVDITERKRVEVALRESEERFALAVAGANEGIFDWEVAKDRVYMSARAQEIFGLVPGEPWRPRREWIALTARRTPGHLERAEAALLAHLRGETPMFLLEFELVLPDGGRRWIRQRGVGQRDAAGRVHRMAGSFEDISDRKAIEAAIRRSETYLEEALRLGQAGSFAYGVRERRQVHWSPTTFGLFDFDPGPSPPSAEELWTRIHPEDVAAVRQARERAIRDKCEYVARYRAVHRDGSIRYLQSAGRPWLDEQGNVTELVGVVMDVTEPTLAERTLRESEARFRALTELSSDWFWRQDETLRFRYMSKLAPALGGYPAEVSVGKLRWELPGLVPLSCSWAEHQATLEARLPFRDLELARTLPDGTVAYLSISGAPIFDEAGRFLGYQGVGRDISAGKRIEEALRAREEQLRSAQRLEALGTLAGGIAHDFNNILGAILGYGEMALRDAPAGSRLRRDLDSIVAAGERGRALVERILAFSRSGVSERVAVHVETVVGEALDLLRASLPPGVRIEADLRAGRAAMLGDPTQVHQVVMNLASNGIQAMAGGGTLWVYLVVERFAEPRVAVTGTVPAGEYIVLRVVDEGSGIAAGILDRIFDPFFTTKDVGVGTGLGLSLVHGIVAEVGGAVDVSTEANLGSVFTVYLPRQGDAAVSNGRMATEMPRGHGERVLIVDDEEPLVRLATATLSDLGYDPVGFTSSAGALEALRAAPESFDAVITDERMPGLSGTALIGAVRGIRRDIPILLVSGYIGGSIVNRAYNAGADEVLRKPLAARDLAASLARLLQSP